MTTFDSPPRPPTPHQKCLLGMTVASQQSGPHVHAPANVVFSPWRQRIDLMSDRRKKNTPLEKHTQAHAEKHVGIKSCVLSSDMLPFYQLNINDKSLWQGDKSILTGTLTKNATDKEDTTRWNEIKQRPLKEIKTHPGTWQKRGRTRY